MYFLHQVLGGLLLCLSVSAAEDDTLCVTRRCLASQLVEKEIVTQPQSPFCDIIVTILYLQYQTIAVDTKNMYFSSQLRLKMKWNDPDLEWDKTVHNFTFLVLPASKIWTPDLTVDNAVDVKTKPISGDVVVESNGDVEYSIIMYTTVKCTINLFTYPLVNDFCPVALNGWKNKEGCGMHLTFENNSLNWIKGSAAEWITNTVDIRGNRSRNYLYVELTVSPFNPVVSLVVPSVLILVADIMSCMLPLGGGERNSFKVTLVLSFTMFLLVLTEQLPDSGDCSPLIRYHFLICLLFLVLSMLTSLVLTGISASCSFIICQRGKGTEDNQEYPQREKGGEVTGGSQNHGLEMKNDPVQRTVAFLANKHQQEWKESKAKAHAEKLDRICFLIYVSLCTIYLICIVTIANKPFCIPNNLDFWSDD